MIPDDRFGSPRPMQPPSNDSRLDHAFQEWLQKWRAEDASRLEDFLAEQPKHLRDELRAMVEDYEILREAVGEEVPSFSAGRILGDYRLIRELGRGGMGAVWEADQLSLNRRVALKLLKPQFNFSPLQLQRFHREAMAGGRLQHVSIVQTYAIGESDGVNWIAQELVPGGCTMADSIAAVRDRKILPGDYYPEVARLFIQISDALEHAHRQGVIHRDLKPDNILMNGEDMAKVADFGLAQIEDDLGLSRSGEYLGTPYYMSPEQATTNRMKMDHRSDVFSLGATLYEALTMTRAFEGDTSHQVFQKILMVDPPDPIKLRSRVPRDLAVICGKCLEKNPDRRYGSMAELSEDLRRHLHNQPILARPPGALQRVAKFARRHPVISISGSIATAALVAISILATDLAHQRDLKEDALQVAKEESRTALRVSDYLLSLFLANNPNRARGEVLTARDLLDRGVEQVEHLSQEPLSQAQVLWVMGYAYRGLGLYEEAAPLLERSASIHLQAQGPDHPDTLRAQSEVAVMQFRFGQFAEAEQTQRQAIAGYVRTLGPDHRMTLSARTYLGRILLKQGKLDQAEEQFTQALEVSLEVNFEGHPTTISLLANLGLLERERGNLQEAEAYLLDSIRRSEAERSARDPFTLNSKGYYTMVLLDLGRLEEAERLSREVVETAEQVQGRQHPMVLTHLVQLGRILTEADEAKEAESLFLEALEGQEQGLRADHPDTLRTREALVRLYHETGLLPEALDLAQDLLARTAEDSPRREARQALVLAIQQELQDR